MGAHNLKETTMAFAITPSLGFLDTLSEPYGYWDANLGKGSPQLGSVIQASDGHAYVQAQASAAVASAATVVILTEPAMTFATGAGAWTTRTAAHAIGDRAWLQKTAA